MEQARKQASDAVRTIGLDVEGPLGQFAGALDFSGLFPQVDGPPNAIQQAASGTPLEERLVIIESETGSGKTEAALWRFARMYEARLVDGLYFALPTRAAAKQLHGRATRFVERLFPGDGRPEPVLAVPGYIKAGEVEGHRLQDYVVWWDDHQNDGCRSAAESAKQYLAAQIAVGTVDQAMLAALKVRHSHMRAACLSRNLLVVDEVYASDPYMRHILKALLDAHLDAGGYAMLMSATLGSVARWQWLSAGRVRPGDAPPLDPAIAEPYPAVSVMSAGGESVVAAGENRQEKSVTICAEPLIHDFAQVAELSLRAARDGAKVLVIRNTVSNAVETQGALEQAAGHDSEFLFSVNDIPTLHHSRFASDDRSLLDSEVEVRLGRNRASGGLIVVGTQTLEQSLDIDADLLITDLCPVDVMLQRIGRLHRHRSHRRPEGCETPRCIVLTPDAEDLSPLLKRSGRNTTGLGPHGYVYEDLRVLVATRRLIAEHPQWDIPNMNRKLVENATHPDALDAIAEELGEEWRAHGLDIEGKAIAEVQGADSNAVRRDKSFLTDNNNGSGLFFPSGSEERIRTRLGDEGIEIGFDLPPASPFDAQRPIESMTIAGHLLRGKAPGGPVTPTEANGGFTFAIGEQRFSYDRRGLRRLTCGGPDTNNDSLSLKIWCLCTIIESDFFKASKSNGGKISMYNLLSEPLIRYRQSGVTMREASLAEVYAALMADQVEAFPSLRSHQRHPWHAFLVQLGAMAMHCAGLDAPPSEPDEWRRIIRALTPEWPDDEPWQLAVDNITKPAFMQPPASSVECWKDFKSSVSTPDALDMLVTSKNHDLKSEVAAEAETDDWILALVALQTTEGFGGVGNYGISRMNGSLGNRSAFALAPANLNLGALVRRDIKELLEFMPGILTDHPGAASGHALMWTLPWDGNAAEALLLSQVHPLFLEICRRIRLQSTASGDLSAKRASSKAARIEAKVLNGLTGDPWALVDRRDKKGEKVLTLPGGGFNYKRCADYLTSGDYGRPILMNPTAEETRSEETMELVARGMVRGQGKTEGFHERRIAVRHKFRSAMLRRNSNDLTDVASISQGRISDVGKVQRILSHAIQVFAARGEHDKIIPEQRERARAWLNRLDEIVDATFFDDLQTEFESPENERQAIRHCWLRNDADRSGVINHARTLLNDAAGSLPCPAIHYYKAREAAEGLFEGRIRGASGFPDLFPDRDEEAQQ